MNTKHILNTILAATLMTAAAPAADVGSPAPAFTAKNTMGEDVSLADFKGKIVVLEWNSFSCPFVKKCYAGGKMQELQKTYTAKGVVWLTICSSAKGKGGYHDAAETTKLAAKNGSKSTHFLLDPDGTVGKAYGAKTTPHMFVVNKDGVLAYSGAFDSKPTTKPEDTKTAENYVGAALDALLAGKPVATPMTKPYGCGVKY